MGLSPQATGSDARGLGCGPGRGRGACLPPPRLTFKWDECVPLPFRAHVTLVSTSHASRPSEVSAWGHGPLRGQHLNPPPNSPGKAALPSHLSAVSDSYS